MKTGLHSRFTLVVAVLVVALGFLALLGTLPTLAAPVGAANTADVVVQLGNGDVDVRHITFTQASVTGFEALELAGFEVVTARYSFGAAVCSIEGTGCPTTDCFCSANRWQYLYLSGNSWEAYGEGASGQHVGPGTVDLWSWGQTPPTMTPEIAAAQAALDWLRPQQEPSGGFRAVGPALDVILAVASANEAAASWESSAGNSLLDYLVVSGTDYLNQGELEVAERAGKLALGVAAADADPRNFVGLDLVVSMTTDYNAETGAFGATNWDQALAMLGWRASGEPIPMTATQQLAGRINADGGWSYSPGNDSDVDSTALMLEALVAGGQSITSTAVLSGVAYLDAAQREDAGLPYVLGADQSNSNSTGYGVQGILAAGEDPLGPRFTVTGTTPISFLLGLQLPDGGFAYVDPADGSDAYATVQTIPALVGKPFPYLSRAVAERKALDWIAANQQPDGSFAGFNPGATLDAVLALAAAGEDPMSYTGGLGNTPLDYLETQAADYIANSAAATGKLVLGVVAAGEDPTTFAGLNLVETLQQYRNDEGANAGSYGGGSTFDQAYAILGLVAAGQPVLTETVSYLEEIRSDGGGWGFEANAAAPDADSTGLALQALAAVGAARTSEAVSEGFDFLHRAQNPDGGFPGFDGATSASTTGLALQALAAYDENPESLTWTRVVTDGTSSRLALHTPLDALLPLQSFEGGFRGFDGANDAYSTYAALPGVLGVAYPSRRLVEAQLFLPLLGHNTEWTD